MEQILTAVVKFCFTTLLVKVCPWLVFDCGSAQSPGLLMHF